MKLKNIIMAGVALVATLAFTACQTEWPDTNPLNKQGVNVVAYGPNPVARGGQLRFVGTGLDQITTVVMPGAGEVTEIEHVNAGDIRITVPQNAEFGYITLKDAKGNEYACEKRLTFTEPVAFAAENAFSPAPVKPGKDLTISGDYLNLVQMVVFADNKEVAKFKEHSREKIVLTVPADAQTGKVSLIFYATEDTIPNEIISKEKLEVVLPSVAEIVTLDEKKPGDKITLTGKDFDLIEAVFSTSGDSLEFVKTETSVEFNLPAVVVNGVINVAPASGVKVPVATIGVALPKVSAIAGATDVREGSVITISGKDFEIASNVTFTAANDKTVDAEIEEGRTATELKVKVPAAAISGAFKINTTAGVTVEDDKLVVATQKPAFVEFSPATAPLGADVAVKGQNMDLVVKVTVTGGAEIVVNEGAVSDSVVFTLPYANAETGKVTLHMANGESVETSADLTITAPVCCFVTAWPELEDGEPLQAGSLLCLEVENRDVLTAVEIDGENCEFVRNGVNKIYISTPDAAGKKSHVKLISSNGEIDYAYAFKPNSEIITILWKGAAALGWSGDGQVYIGEDGGAALVAAGAKAGDQLRIAFTTTADDWCAQIWEGHWGTQYDEIKAENYDLAGNGGYYYLTLTDDMLTAMTTASGWGGILLCQGQSMIVTQLALFQKIAVEETLWKGNAVLGWSGDGQCYFMTDGGQEFTDNEVHAGQHLYIYVNATADSWCVQLWEGHWGTQYGEFKAENYDLAGNGGKIDVEITQAMIDAAVVSSGWGGILLMQGQDCSITKITVM